MSKDDDLRGEYDFSRRIRGRFATRYAEGSNVVVLEPDLAAKYRTSEEVNEALRQLEKRMASGARSSKARRARSCGRGRSTSTERSRDSA